MKFNFRVDMQKKFNWRNLNICGVKKVVQHVRK